MYLSEIELSKRGLLAVGENVQVDETVTFFGSERIRLGSNVRIDAHTIISAPKELVTLGNYIHLSVGCLLFGGAGIEMDDFSGFSARVSVFSESDDYRDGYLTNPTVPLEFRNVRGGKIRIRRHVIVGVGSVILPSVSIGDGASVGALTLISKDVSPCEIVSGMPARRVGRRNGERLAELEAKLLSSLCGRNREI